MQSSTNQPAGRRTSAIARPAARLAIALAAWTIVLSAAGRSSHAQNADEDPRITYLRTTVQIDLCGQNLDMPALDQLAGSIQREWPEFDPELYGKLMLEVAHTIDTCPFKEDHKRVRASTYAAQALSTSGAVMSMETQIALVSSLDDTELAGTMEWSIIRERDTKLWLAVWQEAQDAVDPTFNPAREGPHVAVLAPQTPAAAADAGNANGDDSSAPADAPESAAEKAYRQDMAFNLKSIPRFVEQTQARERLAQIAPMAEKALIDLYSHPPDKHQDLDLVLRVSVNDAAARKTILDAVAKNLANPPTTQP